MFFSSGWMNFQSASCAYAYMGTPHAGLRGVPTHSLCEHLRSPHLARSSHREQLSSSLRLSPGPGTRQVRNTLRLSPGVRSEVRLHSLPLWFPHLSNKSIGLLMPEEGVCFSPGVEGRRKRGHSSCPRLWCTGWGVGEGCSETQSQSRMEE